MTPLEQRIRDAAEKATPGQRHLVPRETGCRPNPMCIHCDTPPSEAERLHNAELAALCSPTNILALLDEHAKEVERLDREHEQTMIERDRAEEAADRLAYAIGTIEEIGEHSNCNDPWEQAHILLIDKLAKLASESREGMDGNHK